MTLVLFCKLAIFLTFWCSGLQLILKLKKLIYFSYSQIMETLMHNLFVMTNNILQQTVRVKARLLVNHINSCNLNIKKGYTQSSKKVKKIKEILGGFPIFRQVGFSTFSYMPMITFEINLSNLTVFIQFGLLAAS